MGHSHIGRHTKGVIVNRISTIRRAAGLVAMTIGGVASPVQALPPSAACVYVLRMHDMYVQRANTVAYVAAPSMIWAATASGGSHEAVWHYYWDSMHAAGDWTDIATQLRC
jgi:hypothetical protein